MENYTLEQLFQRFYACVGPERILFGSDFPMWRPADVVELVQKLNLGSDREEKIFYQNAKRWLHIQ